MSYWQFKVGTKFSVTLCIRHYFALKMFQKYVACIFFKCCSKFSVYSNLFNTKKSRNIKTDSDNTFCSYNPFCDNNNNNNNNNNNQIFSRSYALIDWYCSLNLDLK